MMNTPARRQRSQPLRKNSVQMHPSQGETIEETKANLRDALKLVLQCQRELAEQNLSPNAVRERIELADA
jgi:predicted RNase H-like HicB family nuclease